MSYYRRANIMGGTYFFTVVTERRRPILTRPDIRAALREAIIRVRAKRPFEILGWVLLPDHLHAIWRLPDGDADFSTRWSEIKRFVTRECGAIYANDALLTERRANKRHGTIWQHRFWESTITDDDSLRYRMDYLHFNPVKHGLVERVQDWQYSSFHRFVREGIYPLDWA